MCRDLIFHSDPDILGGTPVFVGTRVPVDTLTVHLRHGKRIEDFLDDFPSVSRAQAEAFLKWAEREADLAAIEARRDEPAHPFEDFVARLRTEGRI